MLLDLSGLSPRYTKSSIKHPWWKFLWKLWTAFSCSPLLQKIPSYMFDRVLNTSPYLKLKNHAYTRLPHHEKTSRDPKIRFKMIKELNGISYLNSSKFQNKMGFKIFPIRYLAMEYGIWNSSNLKVTSATKLLFVK